MIGKSVIIPKKGYMRISLGKEETQNALQELIKFNIEELKRVIIETKNSTILAVNQADAIKMLFDKQAISSYTYLQAKLDEKIDEIKKE